MACLLALSLASPTLVLGQGTPPPEAQQAPAQPVFSKAEIDQMTAPIALYPDQLLAQVLMGATYPIEIVQADRWLRKPANAGLKGKELAAALEKQTWDPSVKSLVPFPQVLGMMSDKLDWTQRLGDAFLAQQADVMESVQRLRKQAQDAGTLKSTEQQTVVSSGDAVVIQPANPQIVYVPSYNPSVAYGSWPYPAYPPVYYPPPPAYYPGYYPGTALASGLAFGFGVAVVGSLWGWGSVNWGHNDININTNRYNTINAANIRSGRSSQLSANANNWRHDPGHRGGVAYRDPGTRQAYRGQGARPSASRDFRGYDGGQRNLGQGTSRSPGGQSASGGRQAGGSTLRSPSQRPQPSAFQGVGNGAQTRMQADRGRASERSFTSNAPRSRSMAGGGGMRGGGGRGGRR